MKKLVLKAQKNELVGKYVVIIAEQTHIMGSFGSDRVRGMDAMCFLASNGVNLSSNQYPANDLADDGCGTFYVRGLDESKKDWPVFVTEKQLEKIKVAVREYNEFFKDEVFNYAENSNIITIQ